MSEVQQHSSKTNDGVLITDAAKAHLLSCLIKEEGCQGVRLSVKKSGCSGLSYVVDFVSTIVEDDIQVPLNDLYQVYIARQSYPFLKGMTVDFVKQGINQKFVFSNPNQTGQCGCGESFTVESF